MPQSPTWLAFKRSLAQNALTSEVVDYILCLVSWSHAWLEVTRYLVVMPVGAMLEVATFQTYNSGEKEEV